MTVIRLENRLVEWGCDMVNAIYDVARTNSKGSVSSRNFLKGLYGDSWETIKERMETEGSVWYVWYIGGVYKFIQLAKEMENEE